MRGARDEQDLLRALLQKRHRVDEIAETLGSAGFRYQPYRRIFEALEAAGEETTIEQLAASLDEASVLILQEKLLQEPSTAFDADATIAHTISKLRIREIDDELKVLSGLLKLASAEEKDALIARKVALQHDRQALGGKGFKTEGFVKRA